MIESSLDAITRHSVSLFDISEDALLRLVDRTALVGKDKLRCGAYTDLVLLALTSVLTEGVIAGVLCNIS